MSEYLDSSITLYRNGRTVEINNPLIYQLNQVNKISGSLFKLRIDLIH